MIAADALVALRSPLFYFALNLCREHTLAEDLVSEAIVAYLERPSQEDGDAPHDLRNSVERLWKREVRRRQRLPESVTAEVSVTINGHLYKNPAGRSSYDPYLLVCRDCGDVAARCQCG